MRLGAAAALSRPETRGEHTVEVSRENTMVRSLWDTVLWGYAGWLPEPGRGSTFFFTLPATRETA